MFNIITARNPTFQKVGFLSYLAELYQQSNGHPGQLQQAAADLFVRVASVLPNRYTEIQAT